MSDLLKLYKYERDGVEYVLQMTEEAAARLDVVEVPNSATPSPKAGSVNNKAGTANNKRATSSRK